MRNTKQDTKRKTGEGGELWHNWTAVWTTAYITNVKAAVKVILRWEESMLTPEAIHAVRVLPESGQEIPISVHWSIPAKPSASTAKPVTACTIRTTNAMPNMWIFPATAPASADRQPAIPSESIHNEKGVSAKTCRDAFFVSGMLAMQIPV